MRAVDQVDRMAERVRQEDKTS
eukprot:COSAG03_NODE_28945_length_192_cov_17.311828_2_plen_21_part_01